LAYQPVDNLAEHTVDSTLTGHAKRDLLQRLEVHVACPRPFQAKDAASGHARPKIGPTLP
jgi:hypothetical protein